MSGLISSDFSGLDITTSQARLKTSATDDVITKELVRKSDRCHLRSPSVADVVFKRARKVIPNLENPEEIKPNIKDRFSLEYSKEIARYHELKTLETRFERSVNGSYDAKMHLAINLLRDMKEFFPSFYKRYGEDSEDGKLLLKRQVEALLDECLQDFESDSKEISFILAELPDDVSRW